MLELAVKCFQNSAVPEVAKFERAVSNFPIGKLLKLRGVFERKLLPFCLAKQLRKNA